MNRWLDINTDDPKNAKVLILGIPFDGGTSQEAGAAEGPAKLREFGAVYMPCATDDWHLLDTQPVVYDFGDVDMSGTWEESFARVEKEALALMRHDKFHLFLGGDHSVTIPLHKAFAKAREGKKIGIDRRHSFRRALRPVRLLRRSHLVPCKHRKTRPR